MKKIGIVGCGAIGEKVALFINKNLSKKAVVYALADKNKSRASGLNQKLSSQAKIETIKTLTRQVDLVIEAASQPAAEKVIEQALTFKKDVIILSVGALIKNPVYLKKFSQKNIRLYVPSGAIAGIDALASLAKGNLKKINLTTSKPPLGLKEAACLKNKKINLETLREPKIIFSGDVKKAIKYFPRNINVAATLLLASRFEKVKVVIKADPKIKRNIHQIEAEASEAKIKIEVENIPSPENPKTSLLAILSTQRLLEKIFSPLKIGT